jgi:hypothetical protein
VLVGSARPFGALAGQTPRPQLALARNRVLWTRSGGGNQLETDVWARKAGDRHHATLVFLMAEDGPGGYFGAMAGAGSTLAFSAVYYQCVNLGDCAQLEVPTGYAPLDGAFRVTGTSWRRKVQGVPDAIELAVSGRRVAVLPAASPISVTSTSRSSLTAPGTTVDVRDVVSGALIAQFTPPGTVRALALSATVAAVVDEQTDGTTTIERYDSATGALLGTTDVSTSDALCVSGQTLVYAVGTKIEAMDAATGAQRLRHIAGPTGRALRLR